MSEWDDAPVLEELREVSREGAYQEVRWTPGAAAAFAEIVAQKGTQSAEKWAKAVGTTGIVTIIAGFAEPCIEIAERAHEIALAAQPEDADPPVPVLVEHVRQAAA